MLLQSVGFATIGAFIFLDFAANGRSGTSVALSCFSGASVLVRIGCGHLPNRIDGTPVDE